MPVFLAVVAILCTAAGVVQLVGTVAREGEAVALAEGAVVDGVPQAAGLAAASMEERERSTDISKR